MKDDQDVAVTGLMTKQEHSGMITGILDEDSLQLMNKAVAPSIGPRFRLLLRCAIAADAKGNTRLDRLTRQILYRSLR